MIKSLIRILKIDHKIFKSEVLIILLLVLLFNYSVFLGYSFIVDEDATSLLSFAINGAKFSGWNPISGLGESGFYGDPGAAHAWGIIPLVLNFFSNKFNAYSFIIISLSFAMVLCSFYMLKTIFESESQLILISISLLTFLSPIRYELIFQRHWISLSFCSSLILILIINYNLLNNIKRILILSGIFFLSIALGSTASLEHLFVFYLLLFITYFYINRELNFRNLKNLLYISIVSVLASLILDFWQIFSILYEHINVIYTRDPRYYQNISNFFNFNIFDQILFFFNLLHSGLISEFSTVKLLHPFIIQNGWYCITPIFPFIFAVCIHNFDKLNRIEKTSLLTLSVFIIIGWISLSFPGIIYFLNKYIQLYPMEKFYPCMHVLELILIVFFIKSNFLKTGIFTLNILRILLTINLTITIILFLIYINVSTFNNLFFELFNYFSDLFISSYELKILAKEAFIQQFQLISGEESFLLLVYFSFVCFCLFILKLSITPLGLNLVIRKSYFSLLILAIGFFMSESIYPLNKSQDVWKINSSLFDQVPDFNISRVAKISTPCDKTFHQNTNYHTIEECQHDKLIKHYRNIVGYRFPQSALLNQVKSFSQRDVSKWILHLANKQNLSIENLREFSENLVVLDSPIYNLTGTKYLYSDYPLNNNKSLKLKYEGHQLFVYENINAYNYEFLTNSIIYTNNFDELLNLSKHQIILDPSNKYISEIPDEINQHSNESIQRLISANRSSKLSYEIYTPRKQVFVVLDAWHPLWEVKVDNLPSHIIKVNGIFKGVIVDAGSHKVEFEFNDQFYKNGIFISFIAFLIFIFLVYLLFFSAKSKM